MTGSRGDIVDVEVKVTDSLWTVLDTERSEGMSISEKVNSLLGGTEYRLVFSNGDRSEALAHGPADKQDSYIDIIEAVDLMNKEFKNDCDIVIGMKGRMVTFRVDAYRYGQGFTFGFCIPRDKITGTEVSRKLSVAILKAKSEMEVYKL